MRQRTALWILAITGVLSASCAADLRDAASGDGSDESVEQGAVDSELAVLASVSGSYSASAAVTYALTYCKPTKSSSTTGFETTGYNKFYESYPNDCMNFVSQALAFGGWQPVGGTCWWCSGSWYYLSAGDHNRSNSWAGVNEFRTFMLNSGRTNGAVSIPQNLSVIPRFYAGDVILTDWTGDGIWDHAYFVTEQDGDDVKLAAHTTNRCGDITLRQVRQNYFPNVVFQGFRLKTTYTY
jgi:hypothetical protein